MSTMEPYRPQPVLGRSARALTRLSGATTLAIAVTEAKAEIEAAKIDGISAVAAKALHDVALLSQVEQGLAQAVPHASGRLATIADLASLSLAGAVTDAAHRIGRS